MPVAGPVLLVGCGRLGSAIAEGWLGTGTVSPADLLIRTRTTTPAVQAFAEQGVNVSPSSYDRPAAVVLSVKPANWREAVAGLALTPGVPVISVMAGVRLDALTEALPGHPVARVMPSTSVASARGAAALLAPDATAHQAARTLFGPLSTLVEVPDDAAMDAATAVCGSAPAFIHAFVRGLAQGGVDQGLDPAAALALARGALQAAAASSEDAAQSLEALIARVASPKGTTEAGLNALAAGGLDSLAAAAVEAAVNRARELG